MGDECRDRLIAGSTNSSLGLVHVISPLCTTISNLLPLLRPLHTALSSPAHSYAFYHAGLNRRPGHNPPGRASSSPAKAV
jgi:hypothetical protein